MKHLCQTSPLILTCIISPIDTRERERERDREREIFCDVDYEKLLFAYLSYMFSVYM